MDEEIGHFIFEKLPRIFNQSYHDNRERGKWKVTVGRSLYRGDNSQQAQGVESKTVAFIIKTAQIKRDENDVCLWSR